MNQNNFIHLANAIRLHNKLFPGDKFTDAQLQTLADYCLAADHNFKRDQWLGYIDGLCGPNGGSIRATICACGECEMTTWGETEFKAAAHQLGYDPTKIEVCEEPDQQLQDQLAHQLPHLPADKRIPSADTNQITGVIRVYPKAVRKGIEYQILTHEIEHAIFDGVMKHAALFDQDGAWVKRLDPLLSEHALADCEQGTDYMREWWDLARREPTVQNLYIAISETLACMAEHHYRTGEIPNTPSWKKLYLELRKAAEEIGVVRAN